LISLKLNKLLSIFGSLLRFVTCFQSFSKLVFLNIIQCSSSNF
jgi:hypothetical protein